MRNKPLSGRSGLLYAAVVALTLAATGCHMDNPYQPTPTTDTAKALDELKALPSLEDTKTHVQAAMDQITATAKQVIPSINFQTLDQGTSDNCEQPYDQTDGKRIFLPDAVAANVSVSEDDWAKVLRVAKDAAANRVVVGPRRALACTAIAVRDARLHRPGARVDRVKLRYRSRHQAARLVGDPPAGRHSALTVELEDPVDGAAPGQLACLMDGDLVVGWGTIARPTLR